MKTVKLAIIIFLLSILFFACNERGTLSILDKTYTVEYVDDERNLLGEGFSEKREIKEIKAQNDSIAAEDAYIGFLAKLKVMYKCCESGTDYITEDSITKCKNFVLNSHHNFNARDLMAD